MSHAPCPLTLDDLLSLHAYSVNERNTDLMHMACREYALGELGLRFERLEAVSSAPPDGGVWLALLHAGLPVHIRVSRPWANSLLGTLGLTLDELSRDKLELLCLTRLSPMLPPSVQFQGAAYARTELIQKPDDFVNRGTWVGLHSATGEISGHDWQIMASEAFPVYAFIASFDAYLKCPPAARLARLPLSVPLVAARWMIDAEDLVGLEVGDVLLVG